MTSLEFRDRLARRARRAKAPLTLQMLAPLEAYFRLLARWNAKINLTALPVDAPTDETFDRLLVEPLAAAPYLVHSHKARMANSPSFVGFDLGSGGGSPAIPLLIAQPTLELTMVESKVRKSAFLREAIRVLGLSNATVICERFEAVAVTPQYVNTADVVTVRAVKPDASLFKVAEQLLLPSGELFLFRPAHDPIPGPPGFSQGPIVRLTDAPQAFLCRYRRVFHVEQSR